MNLTTIIRKLKSEGNSLGQIARALRDTHGHISMVELHLVYTSV